MQLHHLFTSVPSRTSTGRPLVAWLTGLLLSLATTLMLGPAPAVAADRSQVGAWEPLLSFGIPGTHMVLMRTGDVLYWRDSDEARVFDPVTGGITTTPSPFPQALSFHCGAHVVLADGRVLAIGGGADPHVGHSATGTFDPLTGTWTRTADMNSERWYATATMLSDGRVLVAGGEDSGGADVNTVEVYDPASDRWTVLDGADRNQALYSSNYLLPDGRIYEAAPRTGTALLNLTTRSWTAGPVSGWKTNGYSESGAMYLPGKIIRSGGTTPDLAATDTATNRTGVIDMTAPVPAWQETSAMAFPRRRHNMVILADGQVMAVGGTRQGDDPQQAVLAGEIWNPDTRQWTTVASMDQPRMYHSAALLLADGRVLTAGGETSTAGPDTPKGAQIYSPPYLFKGARPTIGAAPAAVGYRGSFSVSTPDAASISSVALIRPGAVTHANNMDQRYVPLSFTKAGDGLTVTSPANGNWAPPGWYMLVIKNANGVPSVASWIEIGERFAFEPGPTVGPSAAPSLAPTGPAPTPPTSGTAAGGALSGTGAVRSTAQSSRRLFSLATRRRVHLRDARRRGLAMTVKVAPWMDTGARVVRIQLFRLRTNGRRQLFTTVVRSVRYPESFRLALRSPTLRRGLRLGRYQIGVAGGTSRSDLYTAATYRVTIVR